MNTSLFINSSASIFVCACVFLIPTSVNAHCPFSNNYILIAFAVASTLLLKIVEGQMRRSRWWKSSSPFLINSDWNQQYCRRSVAKSPRCVRVCSEAAHKVSAWWLSGEFLVEECREPSTGFRSLFSTAVQHTRHDTHALASEYIFISGVRLF